MRYYTNEVLWVLCPENPQNPMGKWVLIPRDPLNWELCKFPMARGSCFYPTTIFLLLPYWSASCWECAQFLIPSIAPWIRTINGINYIIISPRSHLSRNLVFRCCISWQSSLFLHINPSCVQPGQRASTSRNIKSLSHTAYKHIKAKKKTSTGTWWPLKRLYEWTR